MKGNKIESYEDLEVYQKLCQLHLEINQVSLKFPQFELRELGSQIRRSSNASPANIAEGWNNGLESVKDDWKWLIKRI